GPWPWRHAHRLPARRLHARPAGRIRRHLRWRRRRWFSPLLRSAETRRFAVRLWLLGKRAWREAPAGPPDANGGRLSMAATMGLAAGRQATANVLDQCHAGAASRLVSRGPGEAVRDARGAHHPPKRCPADLVR